MKRSLFNLVVVCFALFLCACKHSEKPETAFFQDFNLDATVKQMNVAQLQPKLGGGSATSAIGETTERRRDFDLEFLLEERNGKLFDESAFLSELKSEVAEQLSKAHVRANGGGTDNDGFYFNYSTGKNRGSIEVIGARVEGNRYELWCVVRESAGIESDR